MVEVVNHLSGGAVESIECLGNNRILLIAVFSNTSTDSNHMSVSLNGAPMGRLYGWGAWPVVSSAHFHESTGFSGGSGQCSCDVFVKINPIEGINNYSANAPSGVAATLAIAIKDSAGIGTAFPYSAYIGNDVVERWDYEGIPIEHLGVQYNFPHAEGIYWPTAVVFNPLYYVGGDLGIAIAYSDTESAFTTGSIFRGYADNPSEPPGGRPTLAPIAVDQPTDTFSGLVAIEPGVPFATEFTNRSTGAVSGSSQTELAFVCSPGSSLSNVILLFEPGHLEADGLTLVFIPDHYVQVGIAKTTIGGQVVGAALSLLGAPPAPEPGDTVYSDAHTLFRLKGGVEPGDLLEMDSSMLFRLRTPHGGRAFGTVIG